MRCTTGLGFAQKTLSQSAPFVRYSMLNME